MTTVEDRATVDPRESNPGADSADRPIGFGRLQRKEDPRFLRGKGNYIDDLPSEGVAVDLYAGVGLFTATRSRGGLT